MVFATNKDNYNSLYPLIFDLSRTLCVFFNKNNKNKDVPKGTPFDGITHCLSVQPSFAKKADVLSFLHLAKSRVPFGMFYRRINFLSCFF